MAKLSGKRVLVTRPAHQAEVFCEALRAVGAIPVPFPVITIRPTSEPERLERAIQDLEQYDWLILTSVNGVEAFWGGMQAVGRAALPAGLKVASIGPKTSAALARQGVQADFTPEEYVAEAILPGLGELVGKRVLLARADIARADLADDIRAAGGAAEEVVAYCTLPAQLDPHSLEGLRQGVEVVTFTSSSTVQNFDYLARQAGLDPLHLPGRPIFACIGPITARTAERLGYAVDVIAADYTTEGLIQALLQIEIGNQND